MYKDVTVFIFGAGGRQTLPVSKGFHKLGCRVICFCRSRADTGNLTRYHSETILFRYAKKRGEDFFACGARLIKERKFDLVVPLGDPAAKYLSEHKAELSAYSKIAVNDPETLAYAIDKLNTMRVCMANGIPCPKTLLSDDPLGCIDRGEIAFPVVIKPRTGVGSIGFQIITDRDKLEHYLAEYDGANGPLLVQEYVEQGGSPQYRADFYRDRDGKFRLAMAGRVTRWFPLDAGSGVFAYTIHDEEIIEHGKKLLELLDWHGYANIDMVWDVREGVAKIVEINGRTGATIKLDYIAGTNVSQLILEDLLGYPVTDMLAYPDNKKLTCLSVDILWFIKSPDRFRTKPSWFNRFGVKDAIFSWDDPIPSLGFLYKNLRGFKRKMAKRKRYDGGATAAVAASLPQPGVQAPAVREEPGACPNVPVPEPVKAQSTASPYFSIIVPVFNTSEKYLNDCLESLRRQTFSDMEILLVDDGSNEECAACCRAQAGSDPRIRLLRQENAGVSVARNNGLAQARGEWVLFLDADDWLETNACERIRESLESRPCDVLVFGTLKEFGSVRRQVVCALKPDTLYDLNDTETKENICRRLMQPPYSDGSRPYGLYYCWDKAYRRSFLTQNGLRFTPKVSKSEDKLFFLNCTEKPFTMRYLPEVLHHYRINSASVCNRYSPNTDRDRAHLIKLLRTVAKRMDSEFSKEKGEPYTKLEEDLDSFIFAVISDVLLLKFYHPDNPNRKTRRRDAIAFLKSSPFQEGIRTNRYSMLPFGGKVKKFMFSHSLLDTYMHIRLTMKHLSGETASGN